MITAGINALQRIGILAELRNSRALRQTSFLYIGQIAGLFLGFAASLVNTRKLGPEDYGLFAATFAATEFVTLFLDFGFFSSGARVLALKQHRLEEQRRFVGTLILVALTLSLFGTAVLWGASFFANQLLNAAIGRYLRWFCLLLGLLTLQTLIESACRGMGRIEALSFFNLSSKGFGLVFAVIAIASGAYSLPVALAATLVGSLVASVQVLWSLEPRFDNPVVDARELWQDLKSYGFKAYTGDIASTGSARTDSLILAHFVNATAVGYYRLAVLLMTPLTTFSRSLATTLFSRFAGASRISSRVWTANIGWLMFCLLGVLLLGSAAVRLMFGVKYSPVATLLPITALAGVFSGLAVPMNKFLAAKGQGNYLRTIALVLSVCSIVLTFGLIPFFGVMGACYASAVGALINFLLHFRYYRLTVRSTV